jgi:GNAT superfamily N-acetyltransferase
MTPRIREGRPQDAEAVEFVHFASREAAYSERVSGWPVDVLSRVERVEAWRGWLADPSVTTLVVEADDGVAGFCTVKPSDDPDVDASQVVEIPTLYIRPDAWRRGYGLALCREACRRARGDGFRWLTLWVLDLNTEARRFYAALGFREDGGRKVDDNHTAEPLHASRFRLLLSEGLTEPASAQEQGRAG